MHPYSTRRTVGLILSLLLLFCGNPAIAQDNVLKSEYSYRRYTTDDGLPSVSNNTVFQDDRGFIWIGGVSGLVRYDGFTFKNYLPGKKANIFRIGQDKNGHVIALTSNRKYIVDRKTDEVQCITLSELNYSPIILPKYLPITYGIYKDYTTQEQNLFEIGDTALTKILENHYLNKLPDYHRTYYDDKNRQLFLPYNDTLFVVSNEKVEDFIPNFVAHAFCKYKDKILLLSKNGVFSYSKGKIEPFFSYPLDIWESNVKLFASDDGTIYFSTHEKLYRHKDNTTEIIFETNNIFDFIIDRDNSIWVISRQGVYNLFDLSFKKYVMNDRADYFISAVYSPVTNSVFATTVAGKLFDIKNGQATQIRYPESPHGISFFYNFALAHDKTVYFPGPGDLLAYSNGKCRWMNLPFFKTPAYIVPLPDGSLLEGGNSHLVFFQPDGTVIKQWDRKNLSDVVYAKPCIDKMGRLWTGGYDGVVLYDWQNDKVIKTIFDENLRLVDCMNTDREGNVWISSENRLFIVDGDTVQLQKTLPYLIKALHFTRNRNLMVVATLGGIFIFDKEKTNVVQFNQENGFTGEEVFAYTAIDEDADGIIYLPASTGLFCFNPEQLLEKQTKPDLHILSVKNSKNNIEWLSVPENLIFSHINKHVRFSFIGLSYTSTQNVRYHYRLLGFQNEWSEPTKQREVTFNNLPPGNYEFEIFADAGTDESRSEIRSTSFTIQPAFWQTAWFLVLCIAALMLASACCALYIQHRKNRALMEKLRAEKELNELRISSIRLKAIPHFNANILAAIEYYITHRSREDVIRILDIYSDFTYQTLSEVDKAARPLSEELAYVKMYLDLEKIRFLEKFDFEIQVENDVDKNVQLPNMILHTYCENAVKHGLMPLEKGGLLTIHVSQHERIVCVSVEDNGVGRTSAAHNPHLHSSKQGLSILNRQIEIYNRFNPEKINQRIDDLSGDSGTPAGTRFTVEVPLEYNYIN